MKKISFFLEIICALFIMLFGYTGIAKLMSIDRFEVEMFKGVSPFMQTNITPFLAIALPVFEIIVAIALIIPYTRRIALYVTLSLMVVFTLYVGAILSFVSVKPCTCGGVLQDMTWMEHLIFNFFFLILSVLGVIFYEKLNRPRNSTLTIAS